MKDFKGYFIIKSPPEEVYMAITNQKSLELWTGDPAEMEAVPDTEFSLWDGSICGKNLEFEENAKVVQQWYFGEQEEPSIVTLIMHEHKKGTSLEIRHTNIPDDDYEDFSEGWKDSYVAGLLDFLEDAGEE
ncbi:MAG: activator of HSP90 ATPase [Bacteroidia bacterium]|jgi:activator of HSP90 ATPase